MYKILSKYSNHFSSLSGNGRKWKPSGDDRPENCGAQTEFFAKSRRKFGVRTVKILSIT